MPPLPKEPRSSREQTSPHRLAHYNHVVRLPTQSARYTLANTRVEVEKRASCHQSIASEVRRDATGSRIGIAFATSSPSAVPVVYCTSGPRIQLWRTSGDGPLHQQINVASFILNTPSAVEVAIVRQGKSLLVVHRPTCWVLFFRNVFGQPQNVSKFTLATSTTDEAVVHFSQQGDHVVIVTTQQNVFVIGPKEYESTQPLAPYTCRTGRSLWRLGSFFTKPEDPIIHAQWSDEDECLVVVKGRAVEKWQAGSKVSSFALEDNLEFRTLQIQSADLIHVLQSGAPKPNASSDDVDMVDDTDGLHFCVGHYRGGTLEARTPLKFTYPQASKCYLACSTQLLPGTCVPQCIAVGLDNLLVTTRDDNEDVLYDDFFMFGYATTGSAVFLLRMSGLWSLKFPVPEVEEFAQPDDLPALPVGVNASNAVSHSKRIVDSSIANPVGWASAAPVVDDASSGLLLAKAIARKRAAHRSFVAALCSMKIWDSMTQGDKRHVHEHGEKLSMCYALRKFQNEQHIAKGKPGHARQAQAFLTAMLEEVVKAAEKDLPSDSNMSVQERFFSHASQVHRLMELLSSLRDTPLKWSDTLQTFGLTPQTVVTFINSLFLELFRSILAHRDVYGRNQALQDFGRMEWTRQDPFLQVITKQLALTNDVVTDLAGSNIKASDGLLGATESIQRLTMSSSAVLLDPAGELLRQQADLIDYVLEFTADDGRASPAAIALVQKYLMEYAVGRQTPDGRRRRSGLAQCVREPARALAEKWKLFDLLIELSRTDLETPPNAQLMQQYLQRYEADGFHTALFQHHLKHKDWRSLLEVQGVDQPLAEFLDQHNVAMAAVHRLRFARTLDREGAAGELHTSAALFRDAAQHQLNIRERKASLSMAKLVLHLHSMSSTVETNARLVTSDLNKELKVIKLQELFLPKEPQFLAPESTIEKLSAAALTTVHRQERQDKLQAALLLNQQRLDCGEEERSRTEKDIWACIWQAEENDWRQLAQLCRDGISDPDMRQHLEGSLFCTLRYTPEGDSLTRDVFRDLRRNGRLVGVDDRLLDALEDVLFPADVMMATGQPSGLLLQNRT